MKINVEPKGKSTVSITVKIEPAEIARYVIEVTNQLSTQVNVQGFRRGKAPRSVIESRVGKEYFEHQVLERAITDSYYRAIQEHKLQPISRPETKLPDDHHNVEKTGLTYTATVPVLPTITPGEYQKVRVKPVQADFNDAQVEETLAQLRRSRSSEAQADRPARSGDRVEINFVGTLKGKEIPNAKSENHPLVIGEDTFVTGFSDQLIGMQTGQVKKFKVKFPKDYHDQSLGGQKVEFTVTMNQIKEVTLPDLDDAFAAKFGAKSLPELKQRLADNLQKEKAKEAANRTQATVIDKVVDGATVEVPDALVEEELTRMIAEMRSQIEAQGLPYDKYLEHLKKTEVEIKSEARPEAERRVKTSLVLNAIQAAEKLEPTRAQIDAEIAEQLDAVETPEERERIQGAEFRAYVTRILGNRLVIERLVKQATE